jgi:hypothetical protein
LCYGGYELIEGKCYKCPNNCKNCHLDEEKNEFICDYCFSYSAMNSFKECIDCPAYCKTCKFNNNGDLKCTSCVHLYPENIYYGLNSESLCVKCPSICEGCFWKESISNFGCKSCHIGYTLKDDQCLSCPNIPQLGTGCEDCSYDKSLDKFKCYS